MKKLLLGLGAITAIAAPLSMVACSSTDKTFSVDFTKAKTPQDIKDKLEVMVSGLSDVGNKGYKKVDWVVIDGDRKFVFHSNVDADENEQLHELASGLEAFMDITLKARGYSKGYPEFMREYNV